MPTTYTGSPTLTTSITIPVDTDLADANSVNVSSKALMDMQSFLYQTYGKAMQSTSPIRLASTNGTNIIVSPLSVAAVVEGVWKTVFTNTNISIGPANLESGVAYSANTIYYIYVYSNMGAPTFQISTTNPDVFGLYKAVNNFSYKYIGSFITNGASNVRPFTKYGDMTILPGLNDLSGGSYTTFTSLGTENYIPSFQSISAKIAKLKLMISNETGTSHTLFVSPDAVGPGFDFVIPANQWITFAVDLPTGTDKKMYFRFDSLDSPTVPQLYPKIMGYYE